MKKGVNKNGVLWIQEGNIFNCFYQLTNDIELHKTFDNVSFDSISNLTFIELLNEQVQVNKNNTGEIDTEEKNV